MSKLASRQGVESSPGDRPFIARPKRRKSYPDCSPSVNANVPGSTADGWPAWTDRWVYNLGPTRAKGGDS